MSIAKKLIEKFLEAKITRSTVKSIMGKLGISQASFNEGSLTLWSKYFDSQVEYRKAVNDIAKELSKKGDIEVYKTEDKSVIKFK